MVLYLTYSEVIHLLKYASEIACVVETLLGFLRLFVFGSFSDAINFTF